MAYIGSTPTSQNFISGTDYFNGTGSQTAFTLTRSVNSVNDIEVVVNNVIQQPSGYTVSGTTLTLSAAPSSGTNNVYVRYLATNQQSFTVGNNTVGYNQLTSDMQSKFAMKNRIINGAMVIDQRNAGASVTQNTSATYTLDRWFCYGSVSSKFTVQQNAGSVAPPVGFTNYLGVTSSSAYSVGASDLFQLVQRVEGYNVSDLAWGSSNAKTVTLSFWVYSSLTGTFGGSFGNGFNNRSYPFSYTISTSNTWTYISVTIPGDTTGTWLGASNGIGLYISFGLGAGSTYSGTAGSWGATNYQTATGATSVVGTNGATFYITGVQLEVGSSATGFEYRQYGQELVLCQRYFCKSNLQSVAAATAGSLEEWVFPTDSTASLYVQIRFPATMRAAPTITTCDFSGNSGKVYKNGDNKTAVTRYITDIHASVGTDDTTLARAIYFCWFASSEL